MILRCVRNRKGFNKLLCSIDPGRRYRFDLLANVLVDSHRRTLAGASSENDGCCTGDGVAAGKYVLERGLRTFVFDNETAPLVGVEPLRGLQ